LYENTLFLDNLFSYLELQPDMPVSDHGRQAPSPIRHGIEFRNVSFRYPDSQGYALQGVNLHIRPGEKIALVGPNGSGKTTLVKLLTRLYDPTEGEILLDGVNLREYARFFPIALLAFLGVFAPLRETGPCLSPGALHPSARLLDSAP
jgi:ATP-binding cassette subfamily B protein